MGLSALLVGLGVLVLVLPAVGQQPARDQKLILVLSTHEPGIPSVATLIKGIREGLADLQPGQPAIAVEQIDRSGPTGADDTTLQNVFAQKFRGRDPDLIIALGNDAIDFAVRSRAKMWRKVPVIYSDEARLVIQRSPALNITGVAAAMETDRTLYTALQLFPATKRIALISGSSSLEVALKEEFLKTISSFEGRLELIDMSGEPFERLRERLAALPDDAIAYFLSLRTDGTDRSFVSSDALEILSDVSRRPIFGTSSTYLGRGILGGWLIDHGQLGREVAVQAARVLGGEPTAQIPVERSSSIRPMFDWRKLQRWGVKEERLPAGSIVLFAQPSLWQQYRGWIMTALSILLLQAALITLLLLERGRRRMAEAKALRLSGEVIRATENERGRIARELHDDVSQRLALLSIEIDQFAAKPKLAEAGVVPEVKALSSKTQGIADDIYKLAKELHPTTLKLLGLAPAARSFCAELEQRHGLRISVHDKGNLRELPEPVATSLYRVVQEALQNTIKHSGATDASVAFEGDEKGVSVTIADNGTGIAAGARSNGTGLDGMRERLRLVGGTLEVTSGPEIGTTIEAHVPRTAQ
jgi:signal transduction histidine kinase